MVRIQCRISRKHYLRSKQTYEYERMSLHIPRRFHSKVKPFLKQDLYMDVNAKVQFQVRSAKHALQKGYPLKRLCSHQPSNPCIIVQYGLCVISPSSIIHPFLRSSCCTFGMFNAYFTCSQFSALHNSQNTWLLRKYTSASMRTLWSITVTWSWFTFQCSRGGGSGFGTKILSSSHLLRMASVTKSAKLL